MQSLLLMCYILKRRKNIFCLHFKTQLHNYSIDDPRFKKMVYLAVTRLSALLRRIKPTNNGHFHCLNGLHLFKTKKNLNHIKKYAKIKNFEVL